MKGGREGGRVRKKYMYIVIASGDEECVELRSCWLIGRLVHMLFFELCVCKLQRKAHACIYHF